jgi:hypothetical protein
MLSEYALCRLHTEKNASATEYTECQAFSPVVRYWLPPPPHPQACVAPPLVPGGTHSLVGEVGGGGSQFGRRGRHSGTPIIIPLRSKLTPELKVSTNTLLFSLFFIDWENGGERTSPNRQPPPPPPPLICLSSASGSRRRDRRRSRIYVWRT